MTVSSTTNRVSTNGNDVTTAYPVAFPFHSGADLVVLSTVIATGVQTVQALTTDYTISGTPDGLGHYSNGGTVNFVVAPASAERITIYRDPSRTQSLDMVENDNLPAENLEAQLDYLTMLVQRVSDLISRSVRQPDGDSVNIATMPSKVDRASNFAAYDANGDPIAAAGTSADLGPVSSFISTLLDDATASEARATLGEILDGWTPSVGGNATYTLQIGYSVKVGLLVTGWCNLVINVLGTGSATTITGLPYALGAYDAVATVRFLSLSQNVVYVVGYIGAGGTAIILQSLTAAGASVASNNIIGNGTNIRLDFSYIADS